MEPGRGSNGKSYGASGEGGVDLSAAHGAEETRGECREGKIDGTALVGIDGALDEKLRRMEVRRQRPRAYCRL